MEVLHYIAGPLIGAVIGYFTNYIAVKMLFYPRREIRILGHRLPFTPGAIPKGKARLAEAAGQVVAGNLMTKEDIEARLLSGEIESEIADAVTTQLATRLQEELCKLSGMPEEVYQEKKVQLCDMLSQEIVQSLDVRTLIQEKGPGFMKEQAKGKLVAVVMTDKKYTELADFIGEKLQEQIDSEGVDYIRPIVSEKLDGIDSQSTLALLGQFGVREEDVRQSVISAYRRIVTEHVEQVLARLDVASVVTDKINAMTVEEVERLVFLMMKKELNTIVSLGALIGFVLGLLNLFL